MDKELLQWLDGSPLAHEAGTAGELEEQAELFGEELLDVEKNFQQKLKDLVRLHEWIRETVVGRVNLALEAETRSGWEEPRNRDALRPH